MPSCAAASDPISPASLIPNTLKTLAPQLRASFSRLASDSGSAEQIILETLLCVRSIPCSAARFDRWSAKLGIDISTVGSSDWINASWAADGTALPAPTQFMPTPASCADRAQICPAG